MQAECVICMEHFQSSEAISASECGHVFHSACITRWLDESGILAVGHCPQCRSVVNKERLMRLFFADSSTSRATAVNHQRDIDKLQARIAELTKDCRRKEDSIVALNAECRQTKSKLEQRTLVCHRQSWIIDDLENDCRRKDRSIQEFIDACEQRQTSIVELTNANRQKGETIEELTDLCSQRNESLAEQKSRVKQLTKALE